MQPELERDYILVRTWDVSDRCFCMMVANRVFVVVEVFVSLPAVAYQVPQFANCLQMDKLYRVVGIFSKIVYEAKLRLPTSTVQEVCFWS